MKIKCQYCGAENPDNSKFCNKCGKPIPEKEQEKKSRFCGQCGAENLAEAKFCKACGAELEPIPSSSPKPKRSDSGMLAIKILIIVLISTVLLCILTFVGIIVYNEADGGFIITSKPSGARVELKDYRDTYNTPVKIDDLKKKRYYTVIISSPGYVTQQRQIKAKLWPKKKYNFQLERSRGSIYFITEEDGYKIFLNGEDTGEFTPSRIDDLLTGKYDFKLIKPGSPEIKGEIEVKEGTITQFNTVTGSPVHFQDDYIDVAGTDSKFEFREIKISPDDLKYRSFTNPGKKMKTVYTREYETENYHISAFIDIEDHYKKCYRKGNSITFLGGISITGIPENYTEKLEGQLRMVVLHAKTKKVIATGDKLVSIDFNNQEITHEERKDFQAGEALNLKCNIKDDYKFIVQVFWNDVLLRESVTPVLVSPLSLVDFYISYSQEKVNTLKWGQTNYVNVVVKKRISPYDAELIVNVMRKGQFLLVFNKPYSEEHFISTFNANSQGQYHFKIPFIPNMRKKEKSKGYIFDVIFDKCEMKSSRVYP